MTCDWWGLYVSPDIDSITYVLSGMLSRERGWGVKGDTFFCLQAMGSSASPSGSTLATAISPCTCCVRSLLAEGKTLSEVDCGHL